MEIFYIIFFPWYIIGIISFLIDEKVCSREIKVKTLLESLILGLAGLVITGFVIVEIIDFDDTKIKKFLNKKIF